MASSDSTQKLRVLIVDDDMTMRIVMREILECDGFQVEEAADGREAMAVLSRSRVDLVILDIEMPHMNGLEVCAEIRAASNGSKVPVVMTTSLEDVDSIRKAYEIGATDFIIKPVNWTIFPYRIRYIMRAVEALNERKRSEKLVEQLGTVLDNSSNEIYTIDGDTRKFSKLNACALKNLGYSLNDAKLLSLSDIQYGLSQDKVDKLQSHLQWQKNCYFQKQAQ